MRMYVGLGLFSLVGCGALLNSDDAQDVDGDYDGSQEFQAPSKGRVPVASLPDSGTHPDHQVGTGDHDADPVGPEHCAHGHFDHDANPATPCILWAVCHPGYFVSAPGSPTQDQMCAPCPEGQRSSSPNSQMCIPNSVCAPGTRQVLAATTTSEAVCETCAAGNHCPGGAAPPQPCGNGTWDHDTNPATACVAWMNCMAGQFVSANGTATTNRQCTPSVTLNEGLIGYWKFDETSGTAVMDSSGHGNHGVVVRGGIPDPPPHSSPNWVSAGKKGGGLQLDGANDWVRIPSSASINTTAMTGEVTVAAWVKIEGANNTENPYSFIIHRHGGPGPLGLGSLGLGTYLGFPAGGFPLGVGLVDPLVGMQTVPQNTWTHMAKTYDGYTLCIYVNGEGAMPPCKDMGFALRNDITPVTIGWAIGDYTDYNRHYFPGIIDEVRLYNRCLSSQEIKALASN